MPTTPSPARLRNLKQMLTIRRAEEKVIHFAVDNTGLIRGHYHVYIGQEAAGVASCNALGPKDTVWTTHRNHGHVIARGGELAPTLAEIIGRTAGYNGGRGGTFHVIAPELGILQTSGIVGGCMPLAAGAAYSAKVRGTDEVAMCFFGDGSMEEGAFYEAVNLAALNKLPLVFVCENNDVPRDKRRSGPMPSQSLRVEQLTDIPAAFGLPCTVADGCNMDLCDTVMRGVVERVRAGGGPAFVELRITRWPGNFASFPVLHGGPWKLGWVFEPASGPKELQDWLQESDPIGLYIREMIGEGAITRADAERIDAEVVAAVEQAAKVALASPPRPASAALEHVFA
jgi:TPP-dependent pyruvate/acetoin dehydrogenase alpha subunit